MIDAFCSHPDYLTDRGAQLAAGSIVAQLSGVAMVGATAHAGRM